MLVRLEDWRQYVREGDEYLRTVANAARKRPGVFTPVILYNLTAIAIEKSVMGYLMYHGDLADNHTMADLVAALERHTVIPPALKAELLYLDSFQEICDPDTCHHRPPSGPEIHRILEAGRQVHRLVAAGTAGR